jgi:hypothetical protein
MIETRQITIEVLVFVCDVCRAEESKGLPLSGIVAGAAWACRRCWLTLDLAPWEYSHLPQAEWVALITGSIRRASEKRE